MATKQTKRTNTKKSTTRKPATAKKATVKQSTAKKTTSKRAATKKPVPKQTASPPTSPKMSALDAAAKVLAASPEPLNAKTMIERMAAKGYWKSPGGKTPASTLNAALIREIQKKGKDARFQKTERGLFTTNN